MPNKRFLHETIDVVRQAQRFRELIVYISRQSLRDPHFGAIKLNKILYHSDFKAFERFGVPITGVRYFRLRLGPAPRSLRRVRDQLEEEGVIRVERVDLGEVYEQHRTIALRDPITSFFSADELALVDEVIKDLWHQNGKEVSDASHDVRWRVLQDRDPVPYEFAYLCNDPVSAGENERTKQLAAELGW